MNKIQTLNKIIKMRDWLDDFLFDNDWLSEWAYNSLYHLMEQLECMISDLN